MLLAQNLRLLRIIRGWSQETLAGVAGLDRSYISELELARRNVSLDIMERLAHAFEVPLPELLQDPDPTMVGERLLCTVRAGKHKREV